MTYPRPDAPLIPRMLIPAFAGPMPWAPNRKDGSIAYNFNDIHDDFMWMYTESDARDLSALIIQHFTVVIQKDRGRITSMPLLVPSGDASVLELSVSRRVANRLRHLGVTHSLAPLSTFTVGDLLHARQFGVKTLFELLSALDSLSSAPTSHQNKAQQLRLDYEISEYPDVAIAKGEAQQSEVQALAKQLHEMADSRLIRVNDLRLGTLISAITIPGNVSGDSLRDLVERLMSAQLANKREQKMAVTLRELYRRILEYQSMTVNAELEDIAIAATKGSHRNALILIERFGWDGSDARTLQEVATYWGITRERVRQVCASARRRIDDSSLYLPALQNAITIVKQHAPGSANEIEDVLVRDRVVTSDYSISALVNAADMLRIDVPFQLVDSGSLQVVLPSDSRVNVDLITLQARTSASKWGVASLADLVAELGSSEEKAVSVDLAKLVISASDVLEWVDPDQTWFWAPEANHRRNRLINQIRKIMYVAPSIHVSELREGLSRHYRSQGFAPPRRVLLSLCSLLPGLITTGDVIQSTFSLQRHNPLAFVESTMTSILQTHGPVLRRDEFESRCREAGIPRSTFYVYLGNSPIIQRVSRGVYCLRGSNVEPGTAEVLSNGPSRRSVTLDYGWTDDGHVWVTYQVSKYMLQSGLFYVPASVSYLVDGRYSIVAADGSHVGHLSVQNGNGRGLLSFFSRRGGDEDDLLTLTFDQQRGVATVEIADPLDDDSRWFGNDTGEC